jgi:DNA polymerase III subunit beta
MKCTVNAGDLSTALRGPCDRAKPQGSIPILKHVLCEAKDNRLSLLGHDLDSSSEAAIDAEVDAPSACAVPAEPLARLIGGLPKGAHIVLEVAGTDILIKSGRSRYKLPILPAMDMPAALSADGGTSFQMTKDDLEQVFARPRSATDLKDPRPICHGVYVHGEAGKLVSAATSGVVLSRFSTEIEAGEFRGAMIARASGDEILKFGAGELSVSDRIVSIKSGTRTYASKLIETVFPEHYRRTIHSEGTRATIFREAAIESLSRIRAVSDFVGSDLLDIDAGDGELTLSMVGAADGSETIECDGSVSAFVCVRSGHFLDALKALRGEKVEFLIPSEREPFRIIDPSEPSAIMILMPCASRTVRKAQAA